MEALLLLEDLPQQLLELPLTTLGLVMVLLLAELVSQVILHQLLLLDEEVEADLHVPQEILSEMHEDSSQLRFRRQLQVSVP